MTEKLPLSEIRPLFGLSKTFTPDKMFRGEYLVKMNSDPVAFNHWDCEDLDYYSRCSLIEDKEGVEIEKEFVDKIHGFNIPRTSDGLLPDYYQEAKPHVRTGESRFAKGGLGVIMGNYEYYINFYRVATPSEAHYRRVLDKIKSKVNPFRRD